jgi:diacylglycerol kinase family enzyme
MQAHLIYNENAGGKGPSVEDLQTALEGVGFEAVCYDTDSVEELDPILDNAEGLVVAAGGDGTVGAVLTRLIGKNLPLAILPMGTANNIAKSLGLPMDPIQLIAGLENRRTVPFDVGCLHAPWGTEYFFEGAGFGFFADILATYDPEKGKSIWRGLDAVRVHLQNGTPYANKLKLEGEEIAADFLLVEVMNTTAIGPRLKFAPQAAPDDGILELVCVESGDREGLLHYFTSLLLEELDRLETVTVRRVREVSFTWNGFPIHLDGEVRPPNWKARQAVEETEFGLRPYLPHAESGEIRISILPGAVPLWLPAAEEEAIVGSR